MSGPYPPRGSSAGQALGTVGAILFAIGLAVFGGGWVLLGNVENSEINCLSDNPVARCTSTLDNAANESIVAEVLVGVGTLITGVGAALVGVAMVGVMARREEAPALLGVPPPYPPANPPLAPGTLPPPAGSFSSPPPPGP
jgi:hypothetical protein